MANNRQLIQTVNVMTADGSERKLKVLDPEGIPEGTELFRVSKRGEVLPKGSKTHEPKHLWTIKTFVTSRNDKQETFTLTRNEDGKFKHAWDEKTMGAKPKKERKKREGEKDDKVDNNKDDKPKRIRKEKKEGGQDADAGELAAVIAGAVVQALKKTKK